MKVLVFVGFFAVFAAADVQQLFLVKSNEGATTPPPPPKPYAFGYAAGRFPGNIDRTHSEVSDGEVVQGSYSYVDPSHKIRTVHYTADKQGFHPVLNFQPPELPRDSEAVALAKEKHLRQYSAIAEKHQSGYISVPRESEAVLRAKEDHLRRYEAIAEQQKAVPGYVTVPRNTASVQRAADKHFDLFQRIAAEHARIAAERKAEEDTTGVPNHLSE